MRHIFKNAIAAGILFAVFSAGVSGCVSSTAVERPDVDRTRVFRSGFETVWHRLLAAVTTGDERLSFVDKEAGFISFQKNIPVKELDTYAFNDTGMLMSHASANVVIRVLSQKSGRTRVTINTKVTASGKTVLDVFLSRERQVVLDSKGWLEHEYFERLNDREDYGVPDQI